ncbi:hypothetical protein [Streptomyces venezuelae]
MRGDHDRSAPTSLALTVDDGTALKVCAVTLTPTSATTTLGALLDAAQTSAAPTGCVTETTPGTGDGTITSVNGKTNNGSSTWKSSPDGTPAAAASRGTVINAGDTIALRYGG